MKPISRTDLLSPIAAGTPTGPAVPPDKPDNSPEVTVTDGPVPASIRQKSEKVDPASGKMKIDHEKIRQFMDEIRQMKQNEERVIAHEAAHVAAGGQYAGGPSYGYTRGPDGKSYITSGEVPIDVSEEDTPDKTIAKMAVVQKAALAPADPSPADLAIAAQAALIAAINRGKLAAQSNPAATGDSEHDEQPKPPVTGVSAVGGSYVDRQSPKTEVMPTTGGNDRLTGVAGVDAAGVRPPGNTKKQPT